jgi:hypothetical protein
VGLVVAVPAAQGGVAGVCEKKWQRRRFDVAVVKDHVGFFNHKSISFLFHQQAIWLRNYVLLAGANFSFGLHGRAVRRLHNFQQSNRDFFQIS